MARIGRWLGPIVFVPFLVLAPPAAFSSEAWLVLGLTLFMAIWWVTEAAPIPVTALMPVAVLPVLGVVPMGILHSDWQ